MKKDEFDERLRNINLLLSEASKLRKEVAYYIKDIPELGGDFLKIISTRDNLFINYLKAVSEFDYSDNLTVPSDLFPGVRTAAQMADPEELQTKADNMRKAANRVASLANSVNTNSTNTINSVKKCLTAMSELMIQENQIYNFCMDLLKDMNSIYEIGALASST